jgi:acyl-CoA hydrolase
VLHDLVRDGDGLFISSGVAEPRILIDELLSEVVPARDQLQFFQVLTGSEGRLSEAIKQGHHLLTPAPGPLRAEAIEGGIEVLNLSMRQCATAMEAGSIRVSGALLTAVRCGEDLALVPATDLAMVAFEHARFRAVEVLPAWDRAPVGPRVRVAEVDYLVDGSAAPATPMPSAPSAAARRIGRLIAELVPPGAVLELGVGGALDAVAESLVEAGRPVAVHTGLLSDWAHQLAEGGVATVPLPCGDSRSIVAAVAAGTDRFHAWLTDSDAVVFADSRHAHDPSHLMGLQPFVAINSAMAVDVRGQVGVFKDTPDAYPPGGLLDFAIAGAYGGLSIVALTSQTRDCRSRVVVDLGTVQLPSSLVTHVVTEYGIAEVMGRSESERRTALVEIAHPDHRATIVEAGGSVRGTSVIPA